MAKFLQMDGIEDYGTVQPHGDLDLSSNWEISMTLALTVLGQSQRYIINKNNSYALIMGYAGANTVEFFSTSDGNSILRNASALVLDAEKHTITYSYDGTTFKAFLDGTLVNSVVWGGVLTPNASVLDMFGAGVYGQRTAANFYYFSIKKNNVLVAEYTFQNGEGMTVTDTTGKGHDIALSGTPLWLNEVSVHVASANLSANTTFTGSGKSVLKGDLSLSSNSGISADLTRVPKTVDLAGVLSSQSSLYADSRMVRGLSAGISGNANLTASATVSQQSTSSAELQANTGINANIIRIIKAEISLSASAGLQAEQKSETRGNASLSSQSNASISAEILMTADISLSANGRMTIINTKPLVSSVNLTATRELITVLKGGVPMETNQNISIIAGNTLNLSIQLRESTGEPINLDSLTSLRWGFDGIDNGVRKERDNGITVIDAEQGILQISLVPNDTIGRLEKTPHELKVTDGAGNVSSVMRGVITIEKSII